MRRVVAIGITVCCLVVWAWHATDALADDKPRSTPEQIERAKAQLKKIRASLLIDELRAGEQQNEADHKLRSEGSETGTQDDRPWRKAKGGWFSYEVAVYPGLPVDIALGRVGNKFEDLAFGLLVDGTAIDTTQAERRSAEQLTEAIYAVPRKLTSGKRRITVTVKASPEQDTGRVFTLAVLKHPTARQAKQIQAAQAVLDAPQGNLTYVLVGEPDKWPAKKREAIVEAMDYAIGLYNQHAGFDRKLRVAYNPKVPTADGNINGSIRFGGSIHKRTALHEISHTLGIGTHRKWDRMFKDGKWTGPRGNELVKQFNGPDAVIRGDKSHFWPYGMNYPKESNPKNHVRHVKIVAAMCRDMGVLKD